MVFKKKKAEEPEEEDEEEDEEDIDDEEDEPKVQPAPQDKQGQISRQEVCDMAEGNLNRALQLIQVLRN